MVGSWRERKRGLCRWMGDEMVQFLHRNERDDEDETQKAERRNDWWWCQVSR